MTEVLDKCIIDKVIMLLSTDWFFEYWTVVGLDVPKPVRSCLKSACRDTVRDFMSGASELWLISYTNERIGRTQAGLNALLKKCSADEITINRINKLTLQTPAVDIGLRVQEFITHLTDLLVTGSLDLEVPRIDPSLRQALSDFWKRYEIAETDFEGLCLTSSSSWDQYIRSLTPDLPSLLSDSLTVSFVGLCKFEVLWQFIHHELSPAHRDELLKWYRATAELLTGGQETLPDLA